MGGHFPLAAFEQRILADPDVLGMLYTGSLGRDEADRYSDLDIELSLRDAALATPERIAHYLGWLGQVQFVSVTPHAGGSPATPTSARTGSGSSSTSKARPTARPTRTFTGPPL
jgi:hypothetical protein